MTDATRGAIIYYTTNGEKPTTASTRYTKSIEIKRTETIKAFAVAKGYKPSAVAEAAYIVK